MKIVIRAGGVGTRLWPVSRQSQPKQFYALTSKQTMLQESIERVLPITELSDIYISTNAASAELVKEQHPDFPVENIIIEPARKDTAAAIGLESVIIRKNDPDAVVASLGSDHSVSRAKEFQRMLQMAEEMVNRHPDHIVPLGVKPEQPDVGYGYIECGEVIDTIQGKNLWKVEQFKEKPSAEVAQEFLDAGNYLWNANMFVWKVSTILALYEQHLPEMYAQLTEIEAAVGTDKQQEVIERIYPELEKIAVDYAIIEKTEKIAAMSADIGWSDIGDWARLKDELSESEKDVVVVGADHVGIKTENSLLYTSTPEKVIATIGVENIVVIDTDDALLICNKDQSHEVKDMVQKLKDRNKKHVL